MLKVDDCILVMRTATSECREDNFFAQQSVPVSVSIGECRRIPACYPTCRPEHRAAPSQLLCSVFSQRLQPAHVTPVRTTLTTGQEQETTNWYGSTARQVNNCGRGAKKTKKQLSHNPGQGPVMEGLSNAFLAEKDRSCR